MNFTTCPDLRNLTDDDLLARYEASLDNDEIAAMIREMDRRERAARKARRERERRAAIRAEWEIDSHAQYLAADAECRGNLLSKAGIKKGITDEHALWSGREDVARRYASEELNEFWDANGRLSLAEYTRQRAQANRIARAEYREIRAEVKRIHALEVAARRAARNAARAAKAASKTTRRPNLTVITGGKTTAAPAAPAARAA